MKTIILKCTLVATILATTSAKSQIIFEKSVNDLPYGVYTRDQLIADWNTTSGNGFIKNGVGENRVSIVTSEATGAIDDRCLKVKYPANSHDSADSGAQWKTDLEGVYNELYMSYYVKFGPDFGIDKIGKLPGLAGGLNFDDDGNTTEWSGKLMWREGGRLQFYLKQPVTNEKQFDWPYSFEAEKERWYHIEIHYIMNTPGLNDGVMEAWLDGAFISHYNNIPFRSNSNVGITTMFFSTFYGGNETHEPSVDNYAYFDDFKVSTQRIGYSETLSVNSNIKKSTIEVYPNPSANGSFKIERLDSSLAQFNLYSIQGKLLYKKTSSLKITTIKTENLSSGVYILQIKTKNGIENKKIVVS